MPQFFHGVCASIFARRLVWLVWMGALAHCNSSGSQGHNLNAICQPDQCQQSGYMGSDGNCRYVAKADGTSCDDNESCTVYDRCIKGVCTAGTTLPDGTGCNDKNVCTQTDLCEAGVCKGSNPLVCPEGDACHQGGVCDPISGCQLVSYGPCVEGLAAQPLTGCTGSSYTAALTIGGQTFNMLLDSGSTTTAVAMTKCSGCNVTPTYTPSGSSAYQNHNINVSYGDATGFSAAVYQDTVAAGSTQGTYSPVLNMRVGAIYKDPNGSNAQRFFTGGNCDGTANTSSFTGIWGLGARDLAVNYTDTFMDKYASTRVPRYDAFALGLCDMGGNLFLGGFNPSFVSGPPAFTPMIASSPYYAVAVDDALVGTRSVGLASAAWANPIIDSGTDFWYLPDTVFHAMTTLITSDTNYKANFSGALFTSGQCETSLQGLNPAQVDAMLPPLTLLMPSNTTVGATSVIQPATASYLQAIRKNNQNYYCGTLVSAGSNSIIGAAALKRQLVVVDRQNSRVGFAPLLNCAARYPAAALSTSN